MPLLPPRFADALTVNMMRTATSVRPYGTEGMVALHSQDSAALHPGLFSRHPSGMSAARRVCAIAFPKIGRPAS